MTYEQLYEYCSTLRDKRVIAAKLCCEEARFDAEARVEMMDMILDAIDKQIPKKHIIEINNNGLKELHCYSCNATHGVYGDVRIPTTSKYCPYCSQAIDWSDEE